MYGRRAHRLVGLAAVGLLIGSMAACGGKQSSTTAADRILDVFSGANTGFVANFNPFSQNALAGTFSLIYEPLEYFNGGKADDVQPQLATGYTFADDGKTLTFTTRSGVQWSDGQPFSAQDVAFTFNLLKNNPKVNLQGLPVTGATATDSTHVTITFSQPVYTRLMLIAGRTWMVPEHIWSKVADASAFTNDKPVGTGPFLAKSVSPQSYLYVRNPHYWESGKPKIAGLRFHQYGGNDSGIAALAAGQLDWGGMFIADIDKQYVSKDPAHNKYLNESQLYVTNLIPNLAKAPFNDLAVRKAVSLAIDRDQLIKLAFSGYGTQASPVELPRPLYDDYVKPDYRNLTLPYNQQQAEQTLQQAGYAKGSDGIYAKGGKRVSFTVKVVQGYSDYISALQIMTQTLKNAGIEMKTQQISYTAFATDQQTGNFDVIITNLYADGPNPYSWYERAFASWTSAPLGKEAGSNYGRFQSPVVDQALTAIQAMPPDQKDAIKAQLFKAEDVIVAQLPYIPIQQSSSLIEYRTAHFTNFPTEQNHYALATPFGGPDIGIVAKNLVPVG
jgi:peptide/nickel transport system substrate-binding protein